MSGNNNTIKDFKYDIKVNFEVTGISESILAFNNVFNIHSIQNKEWSISVEKFLLTILRVQSIVWGLAVCSLKLVYGKNVMYES